MSAITPAKGLHTLLIDAQRILGGPSGRQRTAVAQQVQHKLLQLRSGRRCERCWLASAHCVCHQLQPLAPLQSVRRVFTVLSARELGSVANSCATFHAACPEHARWAVAGLPGEAWAEVEAAVASGALILFPSPGALPVRRANAGAERSISPLQASGPVDLVVPDGTWAEATQINLRLPAEAPRVVLTEAAAEGRGEAVAASVADAGADAVAVRSGGDLGTGPTEGLSSLQAIGRALSELGEGGGVEARLAGCQATADRAYWEQLAAAHVRSRRRVGVIRSG